MSGFDFRTQTPPQHEDPLTRFLRELAQFFREVVLPTVAIVGIVLLSTFAGIALYQMEISREKALLETARAQAETGRKVIRDAIAKAPRQDIDIQRPETEIGQQAINGYLKFIEGMGGPPPSPPPPPVEWKLKGCKYEPLTKGIRVANGEVSTGDVNLCWVITSVPVLYCIGVALKQCPTDMDMSCIQHTLQMKCSLY